MLWHQNNTHTLGVILVVAGLSSCATGYQASGLTGGYTEKKITDSAYMVTFGGNGFASKDRIYYFWTYRCAELTLEKGYSLFSMRFNQSTGLNPRAGSIRPAVYYPEDGAALIKTSGGAPIFIPGGGGSAHWTYSGTVLMYKKPLPDELLWAVDAEAVVAALKPYVTSNGSAAAPTRNELFRQAYIAHARISVGSGIGISASEPGADPGKPPRSAEKIAQVVESERLVMLQAVYRDYVTHLGSDASGGGNSGHVVLAFSISPNGQVTHSKITSATFLDPRFNSAIEELVKQTEFRPEDVVSTDVKNFDISFGPW
jgi:TonB family protein